MRKAAWLAFWTLGIIWGSSFLLIRISVQEINPIELVFIRTGIAAVGLHLLLRLRGIRIPSDRRTLISLLIIGFGNPAMPFLLIGWAETIIHSSMASILQSTASLFTLVIAHFFFEDERMTPQRVAGMLAGFIGVIVLFGANVEDGSINLRGIIGQSAMVVASMFYASFTTYSRVVLKRTAVPVSPMVVAAMSMTSAAVIMGIATVVAPVFGGPAPAFFVGISPGVTLAAITLGVFNTLAAYSIFYFIVNSLGASRAAMVTYVVPIIGLILGVVFLNEPLGINLIFGAALILGGIGLVNLPRGLLRRAIKPAVQEPSA